MALDDYGYTNVYDEERRRQEEEQRLQQEMNVPGITGPERAFQAAALADSTRPGRGPGGGSYEGPPEMAGWVAPVAGGSGVVTGNGPEPQRQQQPQVQQPQQPQAPAPEPEPLSQAEVLQLQKLQQAEASVDSDFYKGSINEDTRQKHQAKIKMQKAPLMAKQAAAAAQAQQKALQQAMQQMALQESVQDTHLKRRAVAFPETVTTYTDPITGRTAHFQQDAKGNFREITFDAEQAREEMMYKQKADIAKVLGELGSGEEKPLDTSSMLAAGPGFDMGDAPGPVKKAADYLQGLREPPVGPGPRSAIPPPDSGGFNMGDRVDPEEAARVKAGQADGGLPVAPIPARPGFNMGTAEDPEEVARAAAWKAAQASQAGQPISGFDMGETKSEAINKPLDLDQLKEEAARTGEPVSINKLGQAMRQQFSTGEEAVAGQPMWHTNRPGQQVQPQPTAVGPQSDQFPSGYVHRMTIQEGPNQRTVEFTKNQDGTWSGGGQEGQQRAGQADELEYGISPQGLQEIARRARQMVPPYHGNNPHLQLQYANRVAKAEQMILGNVMAAREHERTYQRTEQLHRHTEEARRTQHERDAKSRKEDKETQFTHHDMLRLVRDVDKDMRQEKHEIETHNAKAVLDREKKTPAPWMADEVLWDREHDRRIQSGLRRAGITPGWQTAQGGGAGAGTGGGQGGAAAGAGGTPPPDQAAGYQARKSKDFGATGAITPPPPDIASKKSPVTPAHAAEVLPALEKGLSAAGGGLASYFKGWGAGQRVVAGHMETMRDILRKAVKDNRNLTMDEYHRYTLAHSNLEQILKGHGGAGKLKLGGD